MVIQRIRKQRVQLFILVFLQPGEQRCGILPDDFSHNGGQLLDTLVGAKDCLTQAHSITPVEIQFDFIFDVVSVQCPHS